MIDLETLLAPISDDAPSGEDLEYDPDFAALELVAKPTEERVIGDNVIPAEDPDYEAVMRQGEALLGRTHDLRVAVMLADAALRTRRLSEFSTVLGYIEGCLRDHWESVHPQLDEDDGDPTMRVNAVLALTDRDTLLRSLRQATLIDSRAFGQISLRELQYASGEAAPPASVEFVPDMQTITAAMQDAGSEAMAEVHEALTEALRTVTAISDIFDSHVGVDAPDLSPLAKMLGDMQRGLGTPPDTVESPEDAPEAAPIAAPALPSAAPTGGGAITSPQDVKAALDRIMAYYARYEPSSPLPLLLGRAKRLVSADFVTIMKDMAPLGFENVALIGGFEPEEPEEDTY